MSSNDIVDHIIATNIDPSTLVKIEKQIAVPLRQLISPRENRRRRCIPRPQNNFVLYRRNFHAVITRERGHAVAKNFKLISNEAAKNWSEESNEVKQLYELIADCAKKVHDCTYPQYVYQPKHKSSKKGNNTIFREVTMDTCKQKTKSDRGSSRNEKSPSHLKSSTPSIKSLAASMTSTMTTLSMDPTPPNSSISSISSHLKSSPHAELHMSSVSLVKDESKEWRWAHCQSESFRQTPPDSYQQPLPPPPSQPPNSMQGVEKIPAQQPSMSTKLLPPIDIPISTNFMEGYDKNVWSLVNGYTNL
ncbi:10807_t:CDS:1 [Acaulospora colombiana]|uniref:10807_t:CDS:1 n=1 Tax=Acaulospora colombiana TaxID=27376 RepID=A0ACA9KXT8_9GLOM|nr:10807_t:CDS:1 [Acaulospora colombiana]